MLAYHVSFEDAAAAAAAVGLRLVNFRHSRGRSVRFRLGLDAAPARHPMSSPRYQRRSVDGARRVAAVCWHGHRDFLRALFERAPKARVQTAFLQRPDSPAARYTSENFERVYRDTDVPVRAGGVERLFSSCCVCRVQGHEV